MGSNKLPYFPFYADDYLNDWAVVQMDADAEGCYIRLLAKSWKSETPGVVFSGHVRTLCDAHRLADQYRLLWGTEVRGDCPEESADDIGWARWKDIEKIISNAFDTETKPEYWIQKRMVREYERLSSNLRARQIGASKTNDNRATGADTSGHRNGNRPVAERSPRRTPTEEVEVDLEVEVDKSKPTPPTPSRAPRSLSQNLSEMELPDCVSREDWRSFVEHRKSGKAKLTLAAAKLALGKLVVLHGQGHAPKAVIEQSVLSGWTGVFPLKNRDVSPAVPTPPPAKTHRFDTCRTCFSRTAVPVDSPERSQCRSCESIDRQMAERSRHAAQTNGR